MLFIVAWVAVVWTTSLVQAVRRARANDGAVGFALVKASLRIAASTVFAVPELWLVGLVAVVIAVFGLA